MSVTGAITYRERMALPPTAQVEVTLADGRTVRHELEAYEHGLTDKIEIVALNKIDAVSPEHLKDQKARLKRAAKKTPLLLSGVTGEGVQDALRALIEVIDEAPVSDKAKKASPDEPEPEQPVKTWSPLGN